MGVHNLIMWVIIIVEIKWILRRWINLDWVHSVLWNHNYFLRFRFRFRLLKSCGYGSGSSSGSDLWQVTVPDSTFDKLRFRFRLHNTGPHLGDSSSFMCLLQGGNCAAEPCERVPDLGRSPPLAEPRGPTPPPPAVTARWHLQPLCSHLGALHRYHIATKVNNRTWLSYTRRPTV